MRRLTVLLALACLCPGIAPAAAGAAQEPESGSLSLLLITLDTTRSDSLGCYGNRDARTPVLDQLAAAGTLYQHAVSPAPLTLPAHASLLTGLEPPEHGVRSNGGQALGPRLPTLATVLSAHRYHTAAFIASRVLDRRFGLGRGFDLYHDHMAAEQIGEYGYAERNAAAVTDAALVWIEALPAGQPFFLWVHYYDPHAPYQAGASRSIASQAARYAAEIAAVDHQVGRLLDALPGGREKHVVAAVGDHGEALGEHGERSHGVFLYRAVLEVPLILAGPGITEARRVSTTVAIRALPATLLHLLGLTDEAAAFGPPLGQIDGEAPAIYSEARMPADAYGWAPLTAITEGGWRYIAAPRPELYDLAADPDESSNLLQSKAQVAARLQRRLEQLESEMSGAGAGEVDLDPELAAALRSLGYVSGGDSASDGIDAKDGIEILAEMDAATEILARGDSQLAATRLEHLAQRNPSNIPLLTKLARARLEAGQATASLATYRQAIELDPDSEFLRLNLAHALRRSGRHEAARTAYETVLAIDPRNAPAWLHLADLARTVGDREAEAAVLESALAAQVSSATVLFRLGRLELEAGHIATAESLLGEACGLAPTSVEPWLSWAAAAEAAGRFEAALERCRHAAEIAPSAAEPALCQGRIHLALGQRATARAHLRRAAALGRGTAAGADATHLLASSTLGN